MSDAAPRTERHGFLRSCIASPLNLALTALVLLLILATLPPVLQWAVFDASWQGTTSADCANKEAACWVFIKARFGQIVYGTYPAGERWRVDLVFAGALAGTALLLLPRTPRKPLIGLFMIALFPLLAGLLLAGGVGGLPVVPTSAWGGLMLTLVIAAVTIVSAIPLGLLLALGRRSAMPVISGLATAFIELWRGVPLVAVLFLAVVMFPLFMPEGTELDRLVRVLVAFALFNAAVMAEVFRGALQAIPASQYEAAASLGLGYWRAFLLVVLPQLARIAIPGIVNTCVSIVKETSIVLIVGLVDFLAVIQAGSADPAWLVGEHIRATGYLFAAIVFWLLCFALSRYSASLERRLGAAPRRRLAAAGAAEG